MMIKTRPSLLLAFSIILLASCKNQSTDPQETDLLRETGILGTWEIQTYVVNGIMDLSVECCEFTEFREDDQPDDYHGTYRTYGPGYESNGSFTLNVPNSTLTLDDPDNPRVFEYLIQDDQLRIRYTEDEDDIEITYIKRE